MTRKFPTDALMNTFVLAALVFFASPVFLAHAASSAQGVPPAEREMTYWQLLVSGGVCMIFLGLLSLLATISVIYHLIHVRPDKLTPPEFTENLLTLLEKKDFGKAVSVCRQQENLISAIAFKGLSKISREKTVVENAVQNEGKSQIEKLWQNLNYLGDMAVIAPMLGLLGTIFGMIKAFRFFKAASIHPAVLTQGLSMALVNTAVGLVIAVPCLAAYSYFRGRISRISSNAETAASEIVQLITR